MRMRQEGETYETEIPSDPTINIRRGLHHRNAQTPSYKDGDRLGNVQDQLDELDLVEGEFEFDHDFDVFVG